MAAVRYPTYLELQPRVPRWVWDSIRVVMVGAALSLCGALLAEPQTALTIWWGFVIPLLPAVFFLAPGLWRNVCPLAGFNQAPRRFSITRGLTLPRPLQKYGFLIAVLLFFVIVITRKVLLNTNGTAVSILLLVVFATAFALGATFKGKSGWCSSFCPLLPVQRLYGQTPFAVVRNAHCEPCVGCAKNCFDFNPHAAQLADVHDEDRNHAALRRTFAAAFPGLIVGFFTIAPASGWAVGGMYGRFGIYLLVSVGSFFVLDALLPLPEGFLPVVYGAVALNLFYWWQIPALGARLSGGQPGAYAWPFQIALLALTAAWVVRSWRKERRVFEESGATEPVRVGSTGEAALARAASDDLTELMVVPGDRRLAVQPGSTLLESIEKSGLPIEVGCRMGVCGADPICVVEGAENLSPVGAEEKMTLERLGLADTTRMACSARIQGHVCISLTPEKRSAAPALAAVADPSIGSVVVIGNGIAGITAADYARRRHGDCEIHVVGDEPYNLYNRMAIPRLINERSALEALSLQPPGWYDEKRITCWLNTQASAIDLDEQRVVLADGDHVSYDRLIVTSGSRSFVPPIEDFGKPGSFVLRSADDAIAVRRYLQEQQARRAVVVGGGLLGLEAAHALRDAKCRVTVAVRGHLLARQVDATGARHLQRFLEGLGLEFVNAEVIAVGGRDRVEEVALADGTTLAADVLLVATGIRSNVELARAAGLEVEHAILVDDHMRTSAPNVFAAGDVAEFEGRVYGLWPTAVEQGRIAGLNSVGGDELYRDTVVPATILKVSGADLSSVGQFELDGEDVTVIVEEDPSAGRYRKLVVSAGEAVGAIVVGYPAEAQAIVDAVREHRQLGSADLERLRSGDWSPLLGRAPARSGRLRAGGAVPADRRPRQRRPGLAVPSQRRDVPDRSRRSASSR